MKAVLRLCLFILVGLIVTREAAAAPADAGSWALYQARHNGGVIDFDQSCHTQSNAIFDSDVTESHADGPPDSWNKPCRAISDRQLRAILDSGIPSISLFNVVIVPDINNDTDGVGIADLNNTDFKTKLTIRNFYVEGGLDLSGSTFLSLNIEDGWIERGWIGGLQVVALNLNETTVAGDLVLAELKMYGPIEMDNAQVSNTLRLIKITSQGEGRFIFTAHAQVGNDLVLWAPLDVSDLDISYSTIKGSVYIFTFSDNMPSNAIKGTLECTACEIDGDLDFDDGLELARDIKFERATIKGVVNVNRDDDGRLHFDSLLEFSHSTIGNINIYPDTSLQKLSVLYSTIGDSLVFTSANYAAKEKPIKLWTLDLTGTTIKGLLDVSGLKGSASWQPKKDSEPPSLNLSDLTVGAFTDCNDSWPATVNLVNFTYGGILYPGCPESLYNFDESSASVNRVPSRVPPQSADHWRNWLEAHDHGPDFNPQPYLFMAKYFASLGEQDWSDTIMYELRSLETAKLEQHPLTLEYVSQSIFGVCAGYELGVYGLTHLARTILITWLIGVVAMLFSSRARQRGLLWCAGASTERLLPLVQLRESYRQFFNGPEGMDTLSNIQGSEKHKMRLRRVYYSFFDLYSLWGWILGSWLVAVLAGMATR